MLKKLNLKPYSVQISTPKGISKVPYSVVQSIENVMMAKGDITIQRLTMSELLRNARIMEKIKANTEKDQTVLVEDADYRIIRKAFDSFRGFGLNEVELCKRVDGAKTVKVKEANKEGKKK